MMTNGTPLLVELLGDDAADAAVAAEDEVIVKSFQHALDAPLLEPPMQPALHDSGGEQRGRVKRRADAAERSAAP